MIHGSEIAGPTIRTGAETAGGLSDCVGGRGTEVVKLHESKSLQDSAGADRRPGYKDRVRETDRGSGGPCCG